MFIIFIVFSCITLSCREKLAKIFFARQGFISKSNRLILYKSDDEFQRQTTKFYVK